MEAAFLSAVEKAKGDAFAYPIYEYLSSRTRMFSDVFCWTTQGANVKAGERAEANTVQLVSGNYFRGLGVTALIGRVIAPDDNTPDNRSVAVISYAFWQRTLGGAATALGQTLRVNGAPVVVVGVLPRSFFGINPSSSPDVILPLAMQPVIAARTSASTNPVCVAVSNVWTSTSWHQRRRRPQRN